MFIISSNRGGLLCQKFNTEAALDISDVFIKPPFLKKTVCDANEAQMLTDNVLLLLIIYWTF